MKRILYFRRDLRVDDNLLFSFGGEVLPIFIFDTNILNKLKSDDKRIDFIFDAVIKLKSDLQKIGLDLKIFYGEPIEIFSYLVSFEFDEVMACGDYDSYAKERDRAISHILHFRYLHDTYIFKPNDVLKKDGTPYLVFTPFYKQALEVLKTKNLEISHAKHTLYKTNYDGINILKNNTLISTTLDIKNIGFNPPKQEFTPAKIKLHAIKEKLNNYTKNRDYPSLNASSNLAIDLRFGTIGVREIIRTIKDIEGGDAFFKTVDIS